MKEEEANILKDLMREHLSNEVKNKMYSIETTNQFEKNYARCKSRGYDMSIIHTAIEILEQNGTLPAKPYKTHKLKGKYAGLWEAHLLPDWLIVWSINKKEITILLTHTGTHSDLFKK